LVGRRRTLISHITYHISHKKAEKMNVMQQLLVMNAPQLLRDFAAYRAFHKSDSVINMRIPHEILDKIKEIAAGQKVPYQSLISSILFTLAAAGESPSGPAAK